MQLLTLGLHFTTFTIFPPCNAQTLSHRALPILLPLGQIHHRPVPLPIKLDYLNGRLHLRKALFHEPIPSPVTIF